MGKLSDILEAYRPPAREETLLERAVRRELRRIDAKTADQGAQRFTAAATAVVTTKVDHCGR